MPEEHNTEDAEHEAKVQQAYCKLEALETGYDSLLDKYSMAVQRSEKIRDKLRDHSHTLNRRNRDVELLKELIYEIEEDGHKQLQELYKFRTELDSRLDAEDDVFLRFEDIRKKHERIIKSGIPKSAFIKFAVMSLSVVSKGRGAFFGQLIGDSLGSRYEFMNNKEDVNTKIDSDMKHSIDGVLPMLGGGPMNLQPGELTDDSEMALSMCSMLIHCGGYDLPHVATAYARWSQTNPKDIGIATRAAFNVRNAINKDWLTTMQKSDMERNVPKILENVAAENAKSLSNGMLMRISPLPIFYANDELERWIEFSSSDCSLTHGSPTAKEATRIYSTAMHRLINGQEPMDVYKRALAECQDPIVHKHLELAETQMSPVPYGENFSKTTDGDRNAIGYLGVALQFAFHVLLHSDSFYSGLITVIRKGGDTDTNGCIAGALLGARFGEENIPELWKTTVLKAPVRMRGENGIESPQKILQKITDRLTDKKHIA